MAANLLNKTGWEIPYIKKMLLKKPIDTHAGTWSSYVLVGT